MTTLTIHDVPDDVTDRLRSRAARSGRSLEAEVRAVLGIVAREGGIVGQRRDWRDAVRIVQASLATYRDPERSVVDELIADRRDEARRADR